MITPRRPRAAVLGMMSTMPYGGVIWQTIHYLVGLERLGFETCYVEAHARTPGNFVRHIGDDGSREAAAFIDRILGRFGFEGRWAFQAIHSDGQCYGMSEARLRELYSSAEVLLNLHGGTLPRPEHTSTGRLICVATDPVQLEIELHQEVAATIRFLESHRVVFSFGENYGRPDCLLPVSERFPIRPTRQPVVLDFWSAGDKGEREVFTTIANWFQPWRELRYRGETYKWSKHLEFLKMLELPKQTAQPLELALSRCREDHRRLLIANGWRVRDALELSGDLDAYRQYVETSRAEFTVAKDQNVRLRSGWFSDRSATYLAAGRPVVTQDTGFGNILPTGEGLFGFSSVDEAAAAIEAINTDYDRHRRAAREIAHEFFSHDVVLGRLLEDAGVEIPRARRTERPALRVLLVAHRFPPDAIGGVERYTHALAGELVRAGDVIHVVARRPAAGPLRREVERLPDGTVVHRLAGGQIRRERFLMEREEREALFLEAVAEADPDVVHVNHILDLSPRVLELARDRGAAVVLSLHDYYFACPRIVLRKPSGEACEGPDGGRECARACFPSEKQAASHRWSLRAMYFRRLLAIADRMVCPSPWVADFFARFGADRERLRVIPNGIWIQSADPLADLRSTPKERGRLVLAYLGAVLPHKGLHVVLEALELAGLQAVELSAFGPVGNGAYVSELYARAETVPGLHFRLCGEYESGELPALLHDVDCVIVPSQWPETFCLVAREALARGIPVVVARMGALPDSVIEGVNGFVFDHDRPDALGAVLRRLAEEEDLVPRLRAGARATAVPVLAEHTVALRAIYREALDEAARGAVASEADLTEIAVLEGMLGELGFGAPVETAADRRELSRMIRVPELALPGESP
ncbi:hypothetical protein BH18GEM1_BH18GEM1_07820 [soil metagenome]